jgi:hypothetical protein
MSCLFFFFCGYSSTIGTGLTGGESLVKSIIGSVIIFFLGVSIFLISSYVCLCDLCWGNNGVLAIKDIFLLSPPCFDLLNYGFDMLGVFFLLFRFFHSLLHS